WEALLELARALVVDVEEQILVALPGVVDHLDGGAVVVAVDLGPLGELAGVAHREERLDRDEVVLDAVLLVAAGGARRVARADDQPRHPLEQRAAQAAL